MSRNITTQYVHCSYSEWGSVDDVRRWHMDPPRKWSDIGYHYVIHNQFTTFKAFKNYADAVADEDGKYSDRLFSTNSDGETVKGRPLSIQGAHVAGGNKHSIGICYIGISPTAAQYSAMLVLCRNNILKYPLLKVESTFGHYEYYTRKGEKSPKTCPNFNMDTFRKHLETMF